MPVNIIIGAFLILAGAIIYIVGVNQENKA